MSVDLKIPTVGESITEALISQWFKKVGDTVAVDEPVAELETDKVTLELPSPAAGVITEILVKTGATAKIGEVIARLDDSAKRPAGGGTSDKAAERTKSDRTPAAAKEAGKAQSEEDRESESDAQGDTEASSTESGSGARSEPAKSNSARQQSATVEGKGSGHIMPAAERLIQQNSMDASTISGTGPGGRVLKEDVQRALDGGSGPAVSGNAGREQERVPMTPIRRRIAERLVQAQQGAALLTTFNEIDMTEVMALRKRYQEAFVAQHEVKLGFMAFFVKAAVDALRQYPRVNAQIDGTDVVFNNFIDIGIAVSTERGLMVPVLRNAERLSFAEVESTIADFGGRARSGKIKLEELEGGTFTISNGGIFGSLLSTPIVSPPQSGVLGLHAIQERPVAIDGQVVIRPMMYVALTYDHRMVDGKEAVSFLKRIKEAVEEPARMLLEA